MLRKKLGLREHRKHFLILGFFNSALPFLLFAFAARTLSASMLSVLNATAPMFGVLIAAVWSRQPISPRVALGLVLGTVGVALLVGFDHVSTRPGALVAIMAALVAAPCYSVAWLVHHRGRGHRDRGNHAGDGLPSCLSASRAAS